MSVVVLGSANMDLVVRAPRRPRPGETVAGTAFASGPGGKGLNQAVAARRAGAEVHFIGAVGEDSDGRVLRAVLDDEGIAHDRLRDVPAHTGTAHITVTEDGENTIVVVPGANASEAFDDADVETIATATHLMVQLERPVTLVRAAMLAARRHGVTTVLTPAPVERAHELLELTDLLIANEDEARSLAGVDDAEAAAASLSRGGAQVVVTLGSRGALAAADGTITRVVPGARVDAVDTTAAGDTFAGVLVAALARGDEPARALRVANAAAALTVTRAGAIAAMPSRGELRDLSR